MHQPINPSSIAAPASAYNHAVKVSQPSEWIFLSGQLGDQPDGSCPPDAAAQARQAWNNVAAILAEGGMDFRNLVKVTSYIVGEDNIPAYVDVHRSVHSDWMPPWTLVVVPALGKPEYLVEIDTCAAR